MSDDVDIPDAPNGPRSSLGKRGRPEENQENANSTDNSIGVHTQHGQNVDINAPSENGQATLVKRKKDKQYLNANRDTLIDNKVPFKSDLHGLYLVIDSNLDAEQLHQRLEKYSKWISQSPSLERRLPLNVVVEGTKSDREEFARNKGYEYLDYNRTFYLPAGRPLADAKEDLPKRGDFKEYMVYLPKTVNFEDAKSRGAGYDNHTGLQFVPPGQSIEKFRDLNPILQKEHDDSLSAPTPLVGKSGPKADKIAEISEKYANDGVRTYKFNNQMWADAYSNLAPLREAGLVFDQKSISRYRQILNPDKTKDMAALDLAGWGAKKAKESKEGAFVVPPFTPLHPFTSHDLIVGDPPTGIPQPGSRELTEEQRRDSDDDHKLVERVRTGASRV